MSAVAVSESNDLLACLDPWVRVVVVLPLVAPVEPLMPFFCDLCGHEFGVKPRQARAINAGTRKCRCSFCRTDDGAPREFKVTSAERQFWLQRFSLEEIVGIAELCWGPVRDWDESWKAEFVFETAL